MSCQSEEIGKTKNIVTKKFRITTDSESEFPVLKVS